MHGVDADTISLTREVQQLKELVREMAVQLGDIADRFEDRQVDLDDRIRELGHNIDRVIDACDDFRTKGY